MPDIDQSTGNFFLHREVLWEDRWGLELEFPELVLAMEVEVEVEE